MGSLIHRQAIKKTPNRVHFYHEIQSVLKTVVLVVACSTANHNLIHFRIYKLQRVLLEPRGTHLKQMIYAFEFKKRVLRSKK